MPCYIDPSPIVTVGGGLIAGLLALFAGGGGLLLLFFRRVREGLKRHWGKVGLALAVLAGAAGVLTWQMRTDDATETIVKPETEKMPKRIILLGLDGLSPDVLEPMLADGELPNLQRLRDQGGYRRLATTNPPQSPVAWSTVATGVNPGRHGVFDFIRRDPATYLPDVGITRLDGTETESVRQGKAFWDYATERGVPSVILRCPVTFPPDPINGKMLSGMGVPDLLGTQGTFSFYTTATVDRKKDIGGEVHEVERGETMELELLGPNKTTILGQTRRLAVPFTVTPDRGGARVTIQTTDLDLQLEQWSDWQPVVFKVGPLTKLHGMVRFLLVALEPELKLYVSPISLDPRQSHLPISQPPEYAAELAEELGLYATRGMPFDTWALNEGRITEDQFLAHAEELLEENRKLMNHELARFDHGVFFAYFEYPDIMQHMYWRQRDPEHPLHDPATETDRISASYRKMDAVVGDVLDKLGDDDVLLVFSDHGFTSFRRAAHINSWLRDNGYLVLQDGNVGDEFFGNVDWSQTRAYSLGFGAVYLNLKGREAEGIVEPDAASALKQELIEALRDWQDAATGKGIVHAVHDGRELFRGPLADAAPDLYIGFRRGYRASWQTALGAAPEEQLEDNRKKWSGTHLVDPQLVPGVLFANRKLTRTDPSLYDITPTVLRLLGASDDERQDADLDGTPLF